MAEENSKRKVIFNLIDLETLCNRNGSKARDKAQLKTLVANFDIRKGQLSPNDRLLMHHHFVKLGQRCQKPNFSKLVPLAQTLADHAFKLPERK